MPSKRSRFVQLQGRVCFLTANIWGSRGSRISHSSSVRLLEYGMIGKIWLWRYLNSTEQKMSNGFYKVDRAMDVELQILKHLPRDAHPTVGFIDKYCASYKDLF